jgi:Leucine rich repeat
MKINFVLSAILVILNGSQSSEAQLICYNYNETFTYISVKCDNSKQQSVEFTILDKNYIKWHNVNLKELILSSDNITSFKSGIFTQVKYVEKIHLDNNELSSIDFNEFKNNSKLTHLDMGFNKITKIHPIQVSSNIEIINLEIHNNDLTDFSELCNLKKLKVLNLSRNRRLDLSKVMFNCWSDLTHLFLTDTNLKSLNHDYRMFTGCNKLEYLNLMENELEMLCLQRFPELHGLEYFNIRNNSLTNLDVHGLKQKFQNLWRITTTGNKWSCNYQKKLTPRMNQLNLQEYPNYAPTNEKNCLESAKNDESDAIEICPEDDRLLGISFWIIFIFDCILTIIDVLVFLRYYCFE